MKTLNKKISLVVSSLLFCNVPFALSVTTSCSASNAIELANFESYMSNDLISDLQSKYDIHFPHYTVSEMIPAKFEKNYDIAIPSGYELIALLRNGWLSEIDWSKFNVCNMEGELITNAEEAKTLFIDEEHNKYNGIEQMNNQFTEYIVKSHDPNLQKYIEYSETPEGEKPSFNILRFGVPYFAQAFMLGYKGTELEFYKNGTTEKASNPTWSDVFYTVSPSNPKQDSRFKNKKIAMIDDAKSIYDISRVVETTELGEPVSNKIPDDDSKNRMIQTFSHVTNKFSAKAGNSFILNSDSQIVSKSVADRNADAVAMMSWSGDVIYAAKGAEEYKPFSSEDFHIIKTGTGSLDEIDLMVINNKNEKNPKKLENIYKVIKQVALEGCDKSVEEIVKYNDSQKRFEYWTMHNFDNILYTPMLRNIHTAICDVKSQYWEDQKKEYGYDDKTISELFIPILDGAVPHECLHIFGRTVTNLQNSNTHWAWLESRGKL